ncbi:hypothetical protein EBS80_00045 [bacterium]|nr:hypothetical protein [bacterium]
MAERIPTFDELRAQAGLPPETAEEREARKARAIESNRVATERLAEEARRREAAQAVERDRVAAIRAETDRVFVTLLRAESMPDFLRAVVAIVPHTQRLSDTQRVELASKFDAMVSNSAFGTPEELTAMNRLAETIRGWRMGNDKRKAYPIVRKPASVDAPPVPEPTPVRPPKTVWENVLDLFGWGKKH